VLASAHCPHPAVLNFPLSLSEKKIIKSIFPSVSREKSFSLQVANFSLPERNKEKLRVSRPQGKVGGRFVERQVKVSQVRRGSSIAPTNETRKKFGAIIE
jgi:hypothetical protein